MEKTGEMYFMRMQRYILSTTSITLALLLLAGALPAITGSSGMPAIWTTDSEGNAVNENTYYDKKDVYLSGGPKEGGGLPDGKYWYQVTDTSGTPLSEPRPFVVPIDPHPVQLWPFDSSDNGEYKVWVTTDEGFESADETFLPSLSKTDNFKVIEEGVPKYFELWVTEKVAQLQNVGFKVKYSVDGQVTWTTKNLIPIRTEITHSVYGYTAIFPLQTNVDWEFIVESDIGSWASAIESEVISEPGMINKNVVFTISGHRTNEDGSGTENIVISLEGGVNTPTNTTDSDGFYQFIVFLNENPKPNKVSCQGYTPNTFAWHQFTVDGTDLVFDFINHQLFEMSSVKGDVVEDAFDVVFTPDKKEEGLYKLSSTNTGSFFLKLEILGDFDYLEIKLPIDEANAVYDSPNFILQHSYKGSTPLADISIYEGGIEKKTSDITSSFEIIADSDWKTITITPSEPLSSDSILIKLHLDYQIDSLLTWDQTQTFYSPDWLYTFTVEIHGSWFGGGAVFGVG